MEQAALFDAPTITDVDGWAGGPLTIERTTLSAAEEWIGSFHYSGTPGSPGNQFWEVRDGAPLAMLATGTGANEHGLAKRYDLHEWPGNIELSRVAVHPNAPPNTASRCVAALMHRLRDFGWHWLFSYADTGQNHHGGIYQALNAVYVGVSEACHGYLEDGDPVHPRTIVATYGTRAWPAVRDLAAQRGIVLEKVEGLNTAKHTYILLCGPPSSRRAIRKHLAPHAKPYPKRDH